MALAAAPVVSGAEKLAQAVGKAVKADLIVIGGQWFRSQRVKVPAKNKRGWKWGDVLTPVDYELHVNPIGIGLGAVAGLVALGLGLLAWNGLEIHSGLGNQTLIPGLKESPYWQGFVGKATKGKAGVMPDLSTFDCAKLKTYYDGYLHWSGDTALPSDARARFASAAGVVLAQAKTNGCEWAAAV